MQRQRKKEADLMESLELIKKKIAGAQSLRSIVRTMKILAAVNIRQYEKALHSLQEYNETIEMGLQVVLRGKGGKTRLHEENSQSTVGAVVFGSDMGMCGQFNEQVVQFAANKFKTLETPEIKTIAVGEKIVSRLEDVGHRPEQVIQYPAAISTGIIPAMYEILSRIDIWQTGGHVGKIVLFYNSPTQTGVSYSPDVHTLVPLDPAFLESLRKKEWQSRSLPVFKMDRQKLLVSLMRSHLYASLYRSFLDSLTSENAARLTSMQSAEKHIDEHLEELTGQFNNERQGAITSELLDIIAGAEALSEKQ